MKYSIIRLVYVDDAIPAGTEKHTIESEIKSLGVRSNEYRHKFELIYEVKIGNFIKIK